MKSARLRDGAEPILMPGDPERASRKARAERMPVDEGTLAELDAGGGRGEPRARRAHCQRFRHWPL